MINIRQQNDNIQTYVNEYVADTEADIKDLPTNIYPGSVCIVIETSNVYMLNSEKKWKKLP